MTVADLLCDFCGRGLSGSVIVEPGGARSAVRLMIHPGDPLHKQDSILACSPCWAGIAADLGERCRVGICAICEAPVTYDGSLHVLVMTGRMGDVPEWQFCRPHAVGFLNSMRSTDPKLRVEDLALKADFPVD